jgi:hypothetical protein
MSIKFLNGIDVDNGVLYTDTVNNRVGIGTTNPGSILHVLDAAPILKLQADLSVGSSTISFDNSLGTQEGSLIHNTGSNTFRLNNVSGNSRLNLDNYSAVFSVGTSNLDQSGVILGATTLTLKSNFSTALTCDSAGKVGIGTTTPTDKLTVENGNIRLNSTSSNPGQGLYAYSNNSSPSMGGISWHNNPGFIGSEWYHYKQTSPYTNARIRLIGDASYGGMFVNLNGSDVFAIKTSTGNVGIGTTSPSQKLEVAGKLLVDNGNLGSVAGDTVYHAEITGQRHHLDFKEVRTANGSDWMNTTYKLQMRVDSTNHQSIDFVSDANAKEHIDIYTGNQVFNTRFTSTGNVGIGTTSPRDKFEVKGANSGYSFRVNSESQFVKLLSSDNTGAAYGGFRFNADNGSTELERMRIDSSGNVGIGTTSPNKLLDIENGGFSMFAAGGTSADTFSVVTHNYVFSDDNEDVVYSYDGTNGHQFSTNGTQRVRITQGGYVGIGTTTPSNLLSLKGSGQNWNTSPAIKLWDSHNSKGWYVGSAHNQATGDFYIRSVTSEASYPVAANQEFTIKQTGNVGIGTYSPSEKLHVYNGKAYVTPIPYAANQSAYALKIGAYNNTAFDMGLQAKSTSGGSPYMSFKTSSADDALVMWGNSVGVGAIPNPSYKLDVDGQIRGKQYLRLKDTAGTNQLSIRAESTYGTLDNGSKTFNYIASNHLFLVGGAEKMRINSSGNVGIGTTSPDAKLDIFNTGGSAGSLATCQTYSALTIKPYSSVDSKLTFSANGISTQLIQATNNAGTNGRQISLQPFSGDVGIGVILPSEKLDVNGHIKAFNGYKGYVSHFHSGGFDHFPRAQDGANPMWIPTNYIIDSSQDQYYNTWIALYAGRIRKIILKNVTNTPTATVCTFRKKINGVLSGTTYAGTVTGGGAAGMKVTFDFGTNNFTFNAEDEVQIGIVTGVATQPPMRGVSYQIWYEYNIT